jgi:hypothetical protein
MIYYHKSTLLEILEKASLAFRLFIKNKEREEDFAQSSNRSLTELLFRMKKAPDYRDNPNRGLSFFQTQRGCKLSKNHWLFFQ